MTPLSLHLRLLLAASLVLVVFLGLSGWALDKAYRESAERAMRDQLQGQIYALLAAADEDEQGRLRLPSALPDPRLSNPGSGHYAQVVSRAGDYRWQSASLIGQSLELIQQPPPAPGVWRYRQPLGDAQVYSVNFSILWEGKNGAEQQYTLAAAGDITPLLNRINSFRTTLWSWLGAAALLLLLVQGVVLRWGLKPLRTVAAELRRIETGEAERLSGGYPAELRRLTENINSLIHHSQSQQRRYRNSLDDLAHSLKTPLTVLQNATEAGDAGQLRAAAKELIPQMNGIVQHQLQKAVAAGQPALARVVPVAPLVAKIIRTMDKIYREKGIAHTIAIGASLRFHGTEGDLMEILGNLLDNAYKYGQRQVAITAQESAEGLTIRIEDDGPGIPEAQIGRVLQRGQRADERRPGQGIGLSAAHEIVHLHQGELTIGRSRRLGGACLSLRFPPRQRPAA